jgi:uncharacterized protein (TIGR03435 family)
MRAAANATAALTALIVASSLVSSNLCAQSATPTSNRPSFEVISVKPHKEGPGSNNFGQSGGHVSVKGASLQKLMAVAYNLPSLSEVVNTVVGMPSWGVTDTFDIEAEAPGNPTPEQERLMFQSLLADRFNLALHHETEQRPIYALLFVKPGKFGLQLRPYSASDGCDQSSASQNPQQQPDSKRTDSPVEMAIAALQRFPCGRVVGGFLSPNDHTQVWSGGRKVNMDAIAASIGTMEYTDRPIVNRTGVAGDFDFTVEWDSRVQDLQAGSANPSGLSLFEALSDQLGLKVESQKGSVDVLVIDKVERPTEN